MKHFCTWIVVYAAVCVLAAAVPRTAFAGGTITLRQCIDKAMKDYPLSGYASANTRLSANKYKQSRAFLLPSVDIASSYGRAYGYDPAVTNGGIASLQAVAQVDIFNPSRWLTTKELSMSYEAAKYKQEAVENELAYTVKRMFIDAVTYGEKIAILEENIRSLDDYLALTERLLSSGLVTENDVLRTRIDLDNSNAALKSFIAKRLARLNALSSLTGIPMTPGTVLQSTAVPFTVSSVPALNDVTFSSNPAMQSVRYEERSRRYNVRAEKSKHLPTLGLEADIGWVAQPQPMNYAPYRGYSYLATLDLPIFEWGAVSYGVDAAEMGLQKMHYKRELLKNELTLSYENALKDLASAVERIDLYRKDIKLSKQNFEYSEARYTGGGMISSFEVLLDRQLMTNTQTAMVEAKADFYKSIYKIEFLRGEIYGQKR